MDLYYGKRRVKGHEGKPTFDIANVWPDQNPINYVVHTSYVAAVNMTGDTVKIRVWLDGVAENKQVTLSHGENWHSAVKDFGGFSVVVDSIDGGGNLSERAEDVHVIWELTPGKQ